jgi:hypothetical protein
MELLGNIRAGFDFTDELLIRFPAFFTFFTRESGGGKDSASAVYRLQESL